MLNKPFQKSDSAESWYQSAVLIFVFLLLGHVTAFSADTAAPAPESPAVANAALDRESALRERLKEVNSQLAEIQKELQVVRSDYKRLSTEAHSAEVEGLKNNPEMVKLMQEYEALEKQQLEIKEKMKKLMEKDPEYKAKIEKYGKSGNELKPLYIKMNELGAERMRIMTELNRLASGKNSKPSAQPVTESK